MASYGLKPYNDDDVEEALAISKALSSYSDNYVSYISSDDLVDSNDDDLLDNDDDDDFKSFCLFVEDVENNSNVEILAASMICSPGDPNLLSFTDLVNGWGGPLEFMASYGLKPYNDDDVEEALSISKAFALNKNSNDVLALSSSEKKDQKKSQKKDQKKDQKKSQTEIKDTRPLCRYWQKKWSMS